MISLRLAQDYAATKKQFKMGVLYSFIVKFRFRFPMFLRLFLSHSYLARKKNHLYLARPHFFTGIVSEHKIITILKITVFPCNWTSSHERILGDQEIKSEEI